MRSARRSGCRETNTIQALQADIITATPVERAWARRNRFQPWRARPARLDQFNDRSDRRWHSRSQWHTTSSKLFLEDSSLSNPNRVEKEKQFPAGIGLVCQIGLRLLAGHGSAVMQARPALCPRLDCRSMALLNALPDS
jgi:hypothetical protein